MKKLMISDRWREYSKKYSWFEILKDAASKYPDREALVFRDERVSYKEYLNHVTDLAKGLYSIGVRKGTHVGVWMTNRLEWVYSRLAVYKLGAVLVPLHTRYRLEELKYVLHQSDTEVLIIEDKFLGKIDVVSMLNDLIPGLTEFGPGKIESDEVPFLKSVVCISDNKIGRLLSHKELVDCGKGVNEDEIYTSSSPKDTIHIIYTSGTTGFPKGVETSSSSNMAFCSIRGELFTLDKDSRFLNALPFFGNIGMSNHVLPLLDGGTLVIAGAQFKAGEILKLIQEEKVTHTVFVPTMLIDILNHPDAAKFNLSSIRRIECSGAPVPQELIKKVKERLGISLMNAYGLSEAAGLSTWVPFGDTPQHVERSVGLPLPHCELAIFDASTNERRGQREVGEICTKEVFQGSQHMKGYYKQPELTKECIRDGWLHSGDLGYVDEDGYVYVTGRLKDMFTVGGFNVSPPEIENFLLTHPDIENVAVVGVPDERLGEVGIAFVLLKKGARSSAGAIIEFCKNRIADMKVPRHVFFTEDFPLTPQGKIQKFKIREKVIEELSKMRKE